MTAQRSEISTSFASAREELLSSGTRPCARTRSALTALTDSWLIDLYHASGAAALGATLVAVGGHGRRELSPGSDLDLILLHSGDSIAEVADALWYPIWDSGIRLDHSVRTLGEARRMAATDVRVVLGILDARTLAGDDAATTALRSSVLADWRALSDSRLQDLRASVRERAQVHGDLAHLLEPDVKEAYGGLREMTVLRALSAANVIQEPRDLVEAKTMLLNVRDALHHVTGRSVDRLLHQEQGPVAEFLEMDGTDQLLRAVSSAGRSIGFASDEAWRVVESKFRVRPKLGFKRLAARSATRIPLTEGVVLHDGEAILTPDARPARDPSLVLRAAAAAAQAGVQINGRSLRKLATESAPMPVPWPRGARDALVSLLGAGSNALRVWESLDQAGIIAALLPHWEVIRSAPQHNPVHRFTVDRHLIEAALEAAVLTRRVARPDLLLVGALFHDIGKARPGEDHTVVGVRLLPEIGPHLGFNAADSAALTQMCQLHLLLPEVATRRDLDDPHTISTVAAQVGSIEMLDLLAALTEADALATGPLAWTAWKRSLVADLVARTRAELAGERVANAPRVTEDQWAMAAGDGVRVLLQEHEGGWAVTVGAPDRLGLLGLVAGVLSMHRLEVRSAETETMGARAVEVWQVNPQFGDPPAVDRLREDIRRALSGQLDVRSRLEARDRAAVRPDAPKRLPAVVEIIEGASSRATVLEVRAHDTPGLLHRVGSAIAATGTDISGARVSTLGSEVVDVFFLVDRRGAVLGGEFAAAVADEVSAALNSAEEP